MIQLDRNKSYGDVYGMPGVKHAQDGHYFRHDGFEVTEEGKLVDSPEAIEKAIAAREAHKAKVEAAKGQGISSSDGMDRDALIAELERQGLKVDKRLTTPKLQAQLDAFLENEGARVPINHRDPSRIIGAAA